jgi:murein DD-endopeptidase MepM/ murein hydrolase activator NlpD
VRRRQSDPDLVSLGHGWSSGRGPASSRRRFARKAATVLLLLPLVIGLVGSPTAPRAQGDELADAQAKQAELEKKAAEQKAQIDKLQQLQLVVSEDIKQTTGELEGINADLAAVKVKITDMEGQISLVQQQYLVLVGQLAQLDAQLLDVQGKEGEKKVELAERKALLAQRVRAAYDTDRTSLLESFMSGGSFADFLTEMSYFIDVGQQDKALAEQIVKDQETLAALHQTVVDTQAQTEELRAETADQKAKLDASLADLNTAKDALKKLEQRTAKALASQKKNYAKLTKNKAAAQKAMKASEDAQVKLQAQIAEIIRKQIAAQKAAQARAMAEARSQWAGRIESSYNGTLTWPMAGDMTQPFGCTGFSWEPPLGSCDHFHRGIDLVAPENTPVKAAGDGTIVYIGWNYADGADPAWIVVIAHSEGLQTWYAHMQPRYPGGITAGSHVSQGQVIGYEGNTGHSTGAHLHWAVMMNGEFVNPRLFL